MSEVIQGVYQEAGLPDRYIPIKVNANGEIAVTGGTGGGGGSTPTITGTLTATTLLATGTGTVAAGARAIGFSVVGSASAIIAGNSVPSGTSFAYPAIGTATYGAVTYDATGTSLEIITVIGGTESAGGTLPDGLVTV